VSVVFYFESCERFLCHCTLLFWLSLQGDYEGPKLVLFFSLYMDEPHGEKLETNFCFGLVYKVIVKVSKKSFILFTCMS
jgi:hypothetical protein